MTFYNRKYNWILIRIIFSQMY